MVHGGLPRQHSCGTYYLEVYWPCAGGLSAVNAIGTQMRDPINSGLTRWRMADAGRDCRTRLAKPNSQFLGANADTEILRIHFFCSADHMQDWQPYPVDPYSCYMRDHIFSLTVHLVHYSLTTTVLFLFVFFCFLSSHLWSMDLIITILPVVNKDLPISPRFTPCQFLWRCKFSTPTTRQPMVEFYLLTFPRFPLRKNTNPTLVRIELTTFALLIAGVQVTY